MTKVITIPEFQIDDVIPKIKTIQVFYSAPESKDGDESLFIIIDRDKFNEWLEDSGHLNVSFTSHMYNEEEREIDVTIPTEDFFLEENRFTWPIIKEYLETFHRYDPEVDKVFGGIPEVINYICSHFNKAV